MIRKLRILIVQGHRNTSGGNPAEVAITPLASRAIQRALRAAGHTADMLQNEHNWFPGSLDAVGREVVRLHDAKPYDIMLDIHFEGDANNTRGVFVIVPDGDGLRTHSAYRGTDSMASNPLDVQYAEAIAHGVGEATGLQLRRSGVIKPGVMSEKQTGVGGQGYRLAMFGYTARVRDGMVRLVVELGNIRGDAAIINASGFHDRAAQGVVNGIERVLGKSNVVPMTAPKMPSFGTFTHLVTPVTVTVDVQALNVRKWAETDQPIMCVLHRGASFQAKGWIVGENVDGNSIWWVMGSDKETDLNWRVWSGGTDYTVERILSLPTKEAA